jgi:hypothetical protein
MVPSRHLRTAVFSQCSSTSPSTPKAAWHTNRTQSKGWPRRSEATACLLRMAWLFQTWAPGCPYELALAFSHCSTPPLLSSAAMEHACKLLQPLTAWPVQPLPTASSSSDSLLVSLGCRGASQVWTEEDCWSHTVQQVYAPPITQPRSVQVGSAMEPPSSFLEREQGRVSCTASAISALQRRP